MNITRAEDVSNEIKRRVALIRIQNDAETDIGRDIMMGRRKLPGDDRAPCAVIFEGGDDVKDQPGRLPIVKIQQTYVIDGFDRCDPDNPDVKGHAMIRDMKRVIFSDGGNFNGLVPAVRYVGRDIGPRADGVAIVQARVVIEVEFSEDLRNP
jgi:hypothetical protein